MDNKNLKKKLSFDILSAILIISFIFFLIRWSYSFYYYPEEELTVKLLFESISDGSFYYPIINFFSNFDFNKSFNPNIDKLKNLPIPVGSIFFHSIFYKLFNNLGLFFIDFFGFFYFLIIFYLIFSLFNSKLNSLFFSIVLLIIPMAIDIFNIPKSTIIISQLYDFFNLRIHRPFPSNLYFFTFIYLVLFLHQQFEIKKIHMICLGIILALSFSSFYYFFLIEGISILLLFFLKFKKNFLFELKRNFTNLTTLIITFIIFSIPFIYFIFSHEKDVAVSAGVFELTYEKKIFLIRYYLTKYLDFKFLIINFLLIFLLTLINLKKIKHYQLINIIFIIYLASIFSPIIFIIISSKSGILYHFNNNIIISLFLLFIFIFIIFLKNILKVKVNYFIISLFSVLSFANYIFLQYEQNKHNQTERKEFNTIVKKIKKNNNLSSLLTFDPKFMKWSTLNTNIKYLNLTMSGLTPKTHNMIENDLINVFKFLKLNELDFINFIKNKKQGWRYLNKNTQLFFYMKYTANSLNTYNSSLNFDPEILDFIKKSSPLYSQQLAIPNEEISRLKYKFIKSNMKNFFEPDIIILNKSGDLFKKIKINKLNYCNSFSGTFFNLYVSSKKVKHCNKNIR